MGKADAGQVSKVQGEKMDARRTILSLLFVSIVLVAGSRRAEAFEPFPVLSRLLGNEHKIPNAPRVIPVEEAYPHGTFPPYPPQISSHASGPGRCLKRTAEEAEMQRYYRTQQALKTQPVRYPWGYFGARGGEWSSQQTDYYGTYSETIFSRGAR